MRYLFKNISAVILVALALMWLQSYRFYNSMGVDVSYPSQNGFTTVQYRIRWPGNGSFWVGRIAREYIPKNDSKPELDFGGAIFQPLAGPEIKSMWQRLGFWWIKKREVASDFDPPSDMLNTWEAWFGIPAWLLPSVGGLLWMLNMESSRFRPRNRQ